MPIRLHFIPLILLFSLFYFSSPLAANGDAQKIKFGSVAQDTPAVMHKKLSPLTRYLTNELNRPVSLKLSPNMAGAIKELSTGAVELAYLTPVAYIRAHEKGGSQLVAKMVSKGKGSFQLMIVVKRDSDIKSVADLAGKTFAFGDPAALLQRAAVVGAGMPLEKLGKYEFIGHYDNIARGVARGLFDAGILKDSKAFKWENKGLRILYQTPQLPPYNIAASNRVSKNLLKKMRNAFLSLDIKNPKHKEIIKSMGKKYDGFVTTNNAEYDVVRKLVKPFEK